MRRLAKDASTCVVADLAQEVLRSLCEPLSEVCRKIKGRPKALVRRERYARNVERYGEKGIAFRFCIEPEPGLRRRAVGIPYPENQLAAEARKLIADLRVFAGRSVRKLNGECDFRCHLITRDRSAAIFKSRESATGATHD